MSVFLRRLFAAAVLYGLIFAALGALHDYPQLRQHLHKVRVHNPVAEQRQWLALFYLVNEAGSGMKFLLTGDERHMGHYPSPSHILAARVARAEGGDFRMQLEVARMYYRGAYAPRDRAQTAHWLQRAQNNPAATPAQAQLAAQLLQGLRAEQ